MFRCVIEGTVDGLEPGEHGLAVHETGDISQGCNTVGDHYNPRYLIVSTFFCYLSMGSSMCWRLREGLLYGEQYPAVLKRSARAG